MEFVTGRKTRPRRERRRALGVPQATEPGCGARPTLDAIPFVVIDEVQAGTAEVNVVLRDFVPKQPPGRGVVLGRHVEPACKIAQPRDDDEGHILLALAPADATNLVVRNEP